MPSHDHNTRLIAEHTQGPPYLGILLNFYGDTVPTVYWGTRPYCVQEIRRWMARVSFNDAHSQDDCDSLFALFNLGAARTHPMTDEYAREIQRQLFEYMKLEELPRLRKAGIVSGDSPGTWNTKANEVWAKDSWNGDISLARLEAGHYPPHTLDDVVAAERERKQAYDAAKADLDRTTQQYMKLFADFQRQTLRRGGGDDNDDEDQRRLIEQLLTGHELAVRQQLEGTRTVLEAYCAWQMRKVDRKMWQKSLAEEETKDSSV